MNKSQRDFNSLARTHALTGVVPRSLHYRISNVHIFEVGPRDGLQNEKEAIPTEIKLEYIRALVEAGIKEIEVTSFVHPRAIPQLADAEELAKKLPRDLSVDFFALVPNLKGLDRAIHAGIRNIAVFTAASETFVKKNINMSIRESLNVFEEVILKAREEKMRVRGYVSTSFVCPYEGNISRDKVREVAEALLQIGCHEVSLGDTIGAASPLDVEHTVGYLLEAISKDQMALHFHDTYGTGLANAYVGMQLGITKFDTSSGGLGGCPYAPGASGNLATEDLLYMLDRMNVETGVDLEKVFAASNVMARAFNRDLTSKQWKRLKACRKGS